MIKNTKMKHVQSEHDENTMNILDYNHRLKKETFSNDNDSQKEEVEKITFKPSLWDPGGLSSERPHLQTPPSLSKSSYLMSCLSTSVLPGLWTPHSIWIMNQNKNRLFLRFYNIFFILCDMLWLMFTLLVMTELFSIGGTFSDKSQTT